MLRLLSNLPKSQFQVSTSVRDGTQVVCIEEKLSGLEVTFVQPAFQLDEFLQLFGNAEPSWRAAAIKMIQEHDPKKPSQLTVGLLIDVLKG